MSLFELAKKSTDVVATSASIFHEVYRRWMLQTSLKRFLVTSFRVVVSNHVAKRVQYLTKHHVKMIRTAVSCLLDTWNRKLYASNPAIVTQPNQVHRKHEQKKGLNNMHPNSYFISSASIFFLNHNDIQ